MFSKQVSEISRIKNVQRFFLTLCNRSVLGKIGLVLVALFYVFNGLFTDEILSLS